MFAVIVQVAVPELSVVVELVHADLPADPVTVHTTDPVGVTPAPATVEVNVMLLPNVVGVEFDTTFVGVLCATVCVSVLLLTVGYFLSHP